MATQTLNPFQLSTPKMAYLCLSLNQQTQFHPVKDFIAIGRGRQNQIVIPDKYSSLNHCRIDRRPTRDGADQFILRDLNSRNGTQLNGTNIKEAPLTHMDKISVGQTHFNFSFNNDSTTLHACMKSLNQCWDQKLSLVPQYAATDVNVLLNGPTGCGKEVLAHQIHNLSARREAPFISINCSALSENLVESELFGHLKGGFTDASQDRPGAFLAAKGGTLFLDEIGDLPLNIQPKLLRALDNHEVKPVGGDRTIPTDVRIISATHHDLKRAIAQGTFRSDIYYRLHVITLNIPGLAERMEDFETLLFIMAKEFRVRFSVAAIRKLKTHNWPGNIRELKNVVLRASALFPDTLIEDSHLAQLIDTVPTKSVSYIKNSTPVKEFEKNIICDELIANRGNQRRASFNLGMATSTLHDKIKAYQINIDDLLNN